MNKGSIRFALCTAILASGNAMAGNVVADHDGLTIRSDDGDNELTFGGRLHYDTVRFDSDITPFEDDSDVRRLRLGISGKLADDWRFKLERDVGGTSQGWKNVWVGYEGLDRWSFRAGNMIAPVGMEQQMGSGEMPMMERSLAAALSPGFLTGVQAKYDRRGWTATVGYFTNPLDEELGDAGSDGRGLVGRVTYAPLRREGRVVHVGASFQHRSIDSVSTPIASPGSGFRVRARPGTGLTDTTLVDTGAMAAVDATDTVGMEAGLIAGPVSVLAESLHMKVQRGGDARPDVDFRGWHATAAWMLTGESRRYSSGSGMFAGVRPDRRWGAVELSVRRDHIDLSDQDILGGKQSNTAYGVNWYLGRNFRLMYNHVRAETRPGANGLSEDIGINQLRVQVEF